MGSIGNPKTWVPYMNTKDCSKGFCSLYCPQWCYIIFPPPPPIEISTDDDTSGPNFSPLVIAILGILASAFLLVSYYTIVSKYCGTTRRRRRENQVTDVEAMGDNHNPSVHDHEPWQASSNGLDEALIKSIAVFKYKKGGDTDDHGFIQGTDCSVCLNEFQEDESLRMLPKCSHAFHVQCIDTWLKSHSNCPLCRANIIFVTASAPPPVAEQITPPVGNNEEPLTNGNLSRAFSDLSNLHGREVVIRVREDGYDHQQLMRRSISMDHLSREIQVSVAHILHKNYQEGSSKQSGESSKVSNRMSVLQFPDAMKRSFSSGRFFLTRQVRVRNLSIPL